MSLFQIAEPGESRAKDACGGRVVGIDLGTTHSLVAYVKDQVPVCIADEGGDPLLPSAVYYRPGLAPVVGAAALQHAALAPHDTLVSVKRFMGRGTADLKSADRSAYRFVPDAADAADPAPGEDGKVVRFLVAGDRGPATRQVTPIEASAEILRALRARAEEALGGDLESAVITVPAYFDDAQRQATRDAGRLAGLNVLRLLPEPTAAALAYGLDRRSQGKFAVFDLGGGTFDVSILDLRDGVFTVLATAGDTALGGDDMDRALAELILQRHPEGAAVRARRETDRGLWRELLMVARRLKHQLTLAESATATIAGATVTIERPAFEAAIAPVLQRTTGPCRRALKDAELRPGDLDGVILVGGATRVPAVRRHVEELFQRPPLSDLDPDQVVALGAAVQAEIIGRERSDVLLIDVTPLSLGLELMGGVVERVIARNSRIPTGARQVFTTYADGQTGFDLHVVQGERETAAECRSLARFQLRGIPPMAAGMARLEVTFLIDENGILRVSARELTSGKEAHADVKPSYGLSEDEIERMLLDSYEHAEEDVGRKLLLEQQVEADRIGAALRGALRADGDLLSADERAGVEQALSALAEARAGDDHGLIKDRIAALDEISQDFAQRRMNRSLEQAMAGRAVDAVERAMQHEGHESHAGHAGHAGHARGQG